MKIISLLLLVLTACGSTGRNKPVTAGVFPAGKIMDTIHSKILIEDRFISVHIPETAGKFPSKKYPVVFLFDAEANFDATQNILNNPGKDQSLQSLSDVILVGIGNIWLRDRDYSPSHVESSPRIDPATAKTTGGGETFVSFIEKELLPYIEKKYPVSTSRTLIGHSMGGLMVMNILLKHQQLFDHYVAIDPSMWWDDQKLLKESASVLHDIEFENKTLFLAIANEEDKQMSMEQIKKDTSTKTAMIHPTFFLVDLIEKTKQNKLRFEWKFYKDEHHLTVNAPATMDALKTILQ